MKFKVVNRIKGRFVRAYKGQDSREASWFYVLSRKGTNVERTTLRINGKKADPRILDELNGE
jgi:hypothetical protein